MVDLSLFSDWKRCNACGLPADQSPSRCYRANDETTSPNNRRCKPPTKLMACADCSCVAYHNATCQKSHWRSCHKRECKELASAMLPLKELIRWHKMHKKVKKNNSESLSSSSVSPLPSSSSPSCSKMDGTMKYSEALAMVDASELSISGDGGIGSGGGGGECAAFGSPAAATAAAAASGGKRVWCWWEPDNENGITDETLNFSNTTWQRGARKWDEGEYLVAMEDFQKSLEIYRKAWPYIGKSSGTNERRGDDLNDFFERSFMLAKKLLFCAYCELDATQVGSARQRLVQCLSITMTVFFTSPSRASRESIRSVMNDAWMELMLSMEEVPQHRIIARHVASLAISTKSCGWTDPLQRPGYIARVGLSSIPFTPPEKHPPWCRVLENNWIRILNEYHHLATVSPLTFSNVGSGQRGSGHNDHLVVSGRSWKEYVLFGTGSIENDGDAPFTKQLLRSYVPDAVSLAEQGGGEVIFSKLAPRTHIKAHCGPTNLRLTAHLGLVVPDSSSDCRIRVRDDWHSWSAGKVLLFDDSYEHEVRNDTEESRVVLLLRVWHPGLMRVQRGFFLSEAIMRKEEEIAKRFNPPR